jgi:hypothetical protein
MASTASEWRKMREQGVVWTLPSGLRARLRPVSVIELMKRGRIPDFLTPIAAEAFSEGGGLLKQTVIQQAEHIADLMEAVCMAAFIEPRVIAVPESALKSDMQLNELGLKDNEITVYHLSPEDWNAVLTFVTAPTATLSFFRAQQAADVEPLDGRAPDQDAA